MGSLGSPNAWLPFTNSNSKDCSQGFCSLNCPQWCYVVAPPPPLAFQFTEQSAGTRFSPLVIAIFGILASAFLLVSYYALISKYCGSDAETSRRESQEPNVQLEDHHDPSVYEPWHVESIGLDEAIIRSIAVCKYKKGVGLIEGTCSVCLSEFEEEESIRLLPKCTHAFHIPCIDTWLRSHSSCPLCRSDIVFVSASPVQFPISASESLPSGDHGHLPGSQQGNESSTGAQNSERLESEEEIASTNNSVRKVPLRAVSDLGHWENMHSVIEIGDRANAQRIRRTVSMDHSCQAVFTVADVICMKQEEQALPIEEFFSHAGSSEPPLGEFSRSGRTGKLLDCLMGSASMKRSLSSGRLPLTRHGGTKCSTMFT